MPAVRPRVWACCLVTAALAGCGSDPKPTPRADAKSGELEEASPAPKKGPGGSVPPAPKDALPAGKAQ